MSTLLRIAQFIRALWDLIPTRETLMVIAGVVAILHPTWPSIALAVLYVGAYMGSQIKITLPGGSIEFGGGKPEENGTIPKEVQP